jgi:hypothetical protein
MESRMRENLFRARSVMLVRNQSGVLANVE